MNINMENLINKLAADRVLVFQFFFYFSRIEYCLKRSPKYLKAGHKNMAEPNWDVYANDLRGRFARINNS